MYGIPEELDLSAVVGEFTTQIRVGQFDLQFTFGTVAFAVSSPVSVLQDGKVVASWSEGRWPDAGFFDVMNSAVMGYSSDSKEIILELENDLSLRLVDDSDRYESMKISIGDDLWIV